MEVVAVDDKVAVEVWLCALREQGFLGVDVELPERDAQMVRVNKLLSFKI
jgi:hypothetical protein